MCALKQMKHGSDQLKLGTQLGKSITVLGIAKESL